MSTPRVTVIMPAYNCRPYLPEAIEAILHQTYRDFEFLIIDDGSTDGSGDILSSYARKDSRIVLAPNEQNVGIIHSLNKGLDLARGDYVARMDADDICKPTRLEKQVAYMDSHSSVDVCGCWLQLFGNSTAHVWYYPEDDATIRCLLLFHSSMPHATVMLRRSVFEEHLLRYQEDYMHAEDYALWVYASKVLRFANIPEVLYLYRRYDGNVTQVFEQEKMIATARVRREQLERLGLDFGEDEFALHERISTWDFLSSRTFVKNTETWLRKLKQANDISRLYPEPEFSATLGEKWLLCCQGASENSFWGWMAFLLSPVSRFLPHMRESALMLGKLCLRNAAGRMWCGR